MIAHSLTEKEFKHFQEIEPASERKVFTGPNGDLTSEIRPIDTMVSLNPTDGVKIHTFWKPDHKELEALKQGAFVEFVMWGDHLHPIGTMVWGGSK